MTREAPTRRGRRGLLVSLRRSPVLFSSLFEGGSALLVERRTDERALPDAVACEAPDEAIFLARSWRCRGVIVSGDDADFLGAEGLEVLRRARAAGLRAAVSTGLLLSATLREELSVLADALEVRVPPPPGWPGPDAGSPVERALDALSAARRRGLLVDVTLLLPSGATPPGLDRLARRVASSLGPETPLHLRAAGTDVSDETLLSAARSAREAGLSCVDTLFL